MTHSGYSRGCVRSRTVNSVRDMRWGGIVTNMEGQPPGWHRDPTGRHEQRYWDGVAWSDRVRQAGSAPWVDPQPVDPRASEAAVWIGDAISRKALRTIGDHAAPDETPWLVISSLGEGVLAAFEDRLLILKVGVWTS